ncbi:MAG TPA: hypothetical protein VFU02_01310 [Polyangiaceae bacterium]|nr:hypothetical protein [Polyangiaceae bacterium]
MGDTHFRLCSTCKKPIDFGSEYFRCSVSTCNRKRLELYFCSVPCWDAHVPEARHRDAWAEPAVAPSEAEWNARTEEERAAPRAAVEAAPRRRIVGEDDDKDLPREVLVVVSKLKQYIRARSGMNTSDNVTSVLSDHLRRLCVQAIRHAAEDDRKTVMDRDFTAILDKRS